MDSNNYAVISFSVARYIDLIDWEVKPLLKGKKTQLRRPIIIPRLLRDLGCSIEFSCIKEKNDKYDYLYFYPYSSNKLGWHDIKYGCPFGKPGNILSVRESYSQLGQEIIYKADLSDEGQAGMAWKGSGSMPMPLSRAKIQLTATRIQRLGEMTEKEAMFEGVSIDEDLTHLEAFARHWDEYVNRYGNWFHFKNNPLVWVAEFNLVDLDEGLIDLDDIDVEIDRDNVVVLV